MDYNKIGECYFGGSVRYNLYQCTNENKLSNKKQPLFILDENLDIRWDEDKLDSITIQEVAFLLSHPWLDIDVLQWINEDGSQSWAYHSMVYDSTEISIVGDCIKEIMSKVAWIFQLYVDYCEKNIDN